MEEEHNFIKNNADYETETVKSSSNGIMLIILFVIILTAGICYWIYNSNTYSKFYSYKNDIQTNTQLSNKNDIINRNNIKKNLDYLMEIKYKEYIAPHVNSFNTFINNNPLMNMDTRTISIIFAGTLFTLIASMFLFRRNDGNVSDTEDINLYDNYDNDEYNKSNNEESKNINVLENTEINSLNFNDDDKRTINTNNDGDSLVLKNNYYKYNKNADNVYWNVVKKNKNDENLNINELSLMALKEVENGNDDNAINIYTKILSFNDNNIAVLKSRALLFNKKYEETSDDKYFDAALKDYNRIIDINSFNSDRNTDTLKDRAVLYTKKYHYTSNENYFNLALNDYNKAVNESNKEDLSTLLIYSDLYNEKYKNTHDKKYFKMSLDNYNKALTMDKNNTSIYINRGWLYLTDYKICSDIESLNNAEKDIKHALNLEKDNFYLLNNSGITSLYKYKLDKQVKDLKESEYSFLKSIKNNKSNSVLSESYYYLSLVYDEYSKLTTITAEKMKEYTEKSKHYFEESRKLGYSPN